MSQLAVDCFLWRRHGDMSLEKIGELSSALGAHKVKSFGTQNHKIDNSIKRLL